MTGENGFNLPKHSELENYAYLLLYKYYIKFLLQSKKKSVLRIMERSVLLEHYVCM